MPVTTDPSWEYLGKPYAMPIQKVIEMSREAVNSVQASLFDSFNNTVRPNPEFSPSDIEATDRDLLRLFATLGEIRRQLNDLEQSVKRG